MHANWLQIVSVPLHLLPRGSTMYFLLLTCLENIFLAFYYSRKLALWMSPSEHLKCTIHFILKAAEFEHPWNCTFCFMIKTKCQYCHLWESGKIGLSFHYGKYSCESLTVILGMLLFCKEGYKRIRFTNRHDMPSQKGGKNITYFSSSAEGSGSLSGLSHSGFHVIFLWT